MLASKSDYRLHLRDSSLTDEQKRSATIYWGKAVNGAPVDDGTEEHFDEIIALSVIDDEDEITTVVQDYLASLLP